MYMPMVKTCKALVVATWLPNLFNMFCRWLLRKIVNVRCPPSFRTVRHLDELQWCPMAGRRDNGANLQGEQLDLQVATNTTNPVAAESDSTSESEWQPTPLNPNPAPASQSAHRPPFGSFEVDARRRTWCEPAWRVHIH
jgi:hypothetical protein